MELYDAKVTSADTAASTAASTLATEEGKV